MAINLDKDYDGTTQLSSWWPKVQNNFSTVENAVNTNATGIGALQAMTETLQDRIDIEETARETADTKLQTQIDDEVTVRQKDIAELRLKIGGETIERQDAIDEINAKITSETTARQNADDVLENRIDNIEQNLQSETLARLSEDQSLQAQINVLSDKVSREIPNTWADVQNIIRNGLAEQYFSVGDRFDVERYNSAKVLSFSGSGITAVLLHANFDNDFPNFIGETKAGDYVFTYNGSAWSVEGMKISDIKDYLVITGTPKAGDTVTVTVYTDVLTFDVIGFDHDTPTDSSYTHSMTLQMHDAYTTSFAFDAVEALWYIDEDTYPNGLAAGTYYFTLPSGYDTAYGGGGTFNFTLTKTVPVGGQIRFDWQYKAQALNSKIITYQSGYDTDALETVSVSEGESGTAMPAISQNIASSNTNCITRTRYSSSSWSQSAIRQWLNTDVTEWDWWEAQTVFDRKPSYANTQSGFLRGLDPSFVRAVGSVNKKTQKSVTDGYGLDETEERFFLLSRAEVYGGTERNADGADGTPYAYYKDNSALTAPGTAEDSNRIKYRNGSATYWWLRTSYYASGNSIRNIGNKGEMYSASGSGNYGIVPACVIY